MQTWHKAKINKVVILLHALFLFSSSFPPDNMFAGILKVEMYSPSADVWYLIIDTFAVKQHFFAAVHACVHWLQNALTICNQ